MRQTVITIFRINRFMAFKSAYPDQEVYFNVLNGYSQQGACRWNRVQLLGTENCGKESQYGREADDGKGYQFMLVDFQSYLL